MNLEKMPDTRLKMQEMSYMPKKVLKDQEKTWTHFTEWKTCIN